jgi:hypothetical protein
VHGFHNHPQGARVAANRSWPLRSTLFVALDQLTDAALASRSLTARHCDRCQSKKI